MTTEEIERAILAFVNEQLLHGKPSVDAGSRLFEDGHLDSVRVLELISFIEQTTGRRVPDRSVRLATFRSVRAIALALGTSAPPADADEREPLYEYHTMPDRFASPIDELRRRGELVEFPDGSARLTGTAERLFAFFDGTVARWARELGADDIAAPSTIPVATLDRAGFTTDFPQLLVQEGNGATYSPAVCYHRYAALAQANLDGPIVLGIHGPCRRAETEPRALERPIAFTMREIVVLGAREDVERVRHRVLRRLDRFVTALALDGAIEAADDPFFTSESAGRALAQKAGALKLELRLSLEGGRRVAAASLNRHHDHFGRAFAISLRGAPVHSGCMAFGIERWVLAFLTQHGFDERAWPAPARDALQVQRAHAALS